MNFDTSQLHASDAEGRRGDISTQQAYQYTQHQEGLQTHKPGAQLMDFLAPAQLTETSVSNPRQHATHPGARVQQGVHFANFTQHAPQHVPQPPPFHTLPTEKQWLPKDDNLLRDAVRGGMSSDDIFKIRFSQNFTQQEIIRRHNFLLYGGQRYGPGSDNKQIPLSDSRRSHVSDTRQVPLSDNRQIPLPYNRHCPLVIDSRYSSEVKAQPLGGPSDRRPNPVSDNRQISVIDSRYSSEVKIQPLGDQSRYGTESKIQPLSDQGQKRIFNLVDGQKPNPAKRYKLSSSGSLYVPSEDLLKKRILPNSLEDWESSFKKPTPTSRLLSTQEKVATQTKRKDYLKKEYQLSSQMIALERWYQAEKDMEELANNPTSMAYLRGFKGWSFPMIKDKVVIGRAPMGVNGLDINLTEVYHIQTNSLEPDQHFEYARPSEAALRKVSRLQAEIVFSMEDCNFYLRNMGKAVVFVNGSAVNSRGNMVLYNDFLIEICGFAFLLEVNGTLQAKRQLETLGKVSNKMIEFNPNVSKLSLEYMLALEEAANPTKRRKDTDSKRRRKRSSTTANDKDESVSIVEDEDDISSDGEKDHSESSGDEAVANLFNQPVIQQHQHMMKKMSMPFGVKPMPSPTTYTQSQFINFQTKKTNSHDIGATITTEGPSITVPKAALKSSTPPTTPTTTPPTTPPTPPRSPPPTVPVSAQSTTNPVFSPSPAVISMPQAPPPTMTLNFILEKDEYKEMRPLPPDSNEQVRTPSSTPGPAVPSLLPIGQCQGHSQSGVSSFLMNSWENPNLGHRMGTSMGMMNPSMPHCGMSMPRSGMSAVGNQQNQSMNPAMTSMNPSLSQPMSQSMGYLMNSPMNQAMGQHMTQPSQLMGQPMNQQISQPMGQPTMSPMGQPNQPMGHHMSPPMGQPPNQPMGQSMSHPMNLSMSQAMGQTHQLSQAITSQPMNSPINQSMSPSSPPMSPSMNQPMSQPMGQQLNQQISQPMTQPMSQSMNPMGQPLNQSKSQQMKQPTGQQTTSQPTIQQMSQPTPPASQGVMIHNPSASPAMTIRGGMHGPAMATSTPGMGMNSMQNRNMMGVKTNMPVGMGQTEHESRMMTRARSGVNKQKKTDEDEEETRKKRAKKSVDGLTAIRSTPGSQLSPPIMTTIALSAKSFSSPEQIPRKSFDFSSDHFLLSQQHAGGNMDPNWGRTRQDYVPNPNLNPQIQMIQTDSTYQPPPNMNQSFP